MADAPKAAPGREVVVLRAGPPRGRGIVVDAVVGVIGVALLVLAAVLGATLPEEEVPPRQFKVSYPQERAEAVMCCNEGETEPTLSIRRTDSVPEGQVVEYDVLVAHDNAFQFQVVFGTTGRLTGDDIPSSDPDHFRVELVSPNGTVVGNLTLSTLPPKRNPDSDSTQLYVSEPVETTGSMRFGAKPGTEFVAVNDTSVTKGQVLSQISADKTLETRGVWTLRVTVVDAGDCPPAQPSIPPDTTQRALVCQQATDGGEDPGNPYTIQQVRYDFYTIEVVSPEEQQGGNL